MRVLFTSLRNTSHFLPLVPFIAACRRRGHDVAVAAPSELAERVTATGAAFFPFGHPGDKALEAIWARLSQASAEEGVRIVIGEIFAGANAAAALPDLVRIVRDFAPAVLVRESQEYAAVVAAENAGIPHARVAIQLNGAEMKTFAAATPSVDGHRERLGVPVDPAGVRLCSAPALTLLPGSLEEPADAGTGSIRRFRATRGAPAALPAFWGDDGRPLLYVTLGTVAGGMARARAMYRTTMEAVSTLPLRVLFTTGADLPEDALGPIPSNVHVERFVPQDDVLPEARAILFHGGSGTMLGALSAGVPAVVTPMFADQPYNAERLARAGAGIALPGGAPSVDELRRAVSRVIEDAAFRSAAGRVAAEIAALPPVDDAALEIERIALGRPAAAR